MIDIQRDPTVTRVAIDHRGFREIGPVENFPELNAINQALHGNASGVTIPSTGETVPVRSMARGKVRGIYISSNRYLQQNPTSRSAEGARARNGSQIMWVIRGRDGKYLGKVEDGIVYMGR